MIEQYVLKDLLGNNVHISSTEIMSEVIGRPDFRLYGMDKGTISAFRKMYIEKGGPLPITEKNIELVFHENTAYTNNKWTDEGDKKEDVLKISPEGSVNINDLIEKINESINDDVKIIINEKGVQGNYGNIKMDKYLDFNKIKLEKRKEAIYSSYIVGIINYTRFKELMAGVDRNFTLQKENVKFTCGESLDGKNVGIKKQYMAPKYMRLMFLNSALKNAKTDLKKAVKFDEAFKQLHPIDKLRQLAISLSSVAEISNRVIAINAEIRELDKS